MAAWNSRDHGIDAEPHLRDEAFQPDPAEAKVAAAFDRRDDTPRDLSEAADRSVFDEPGFSPELAGTPTGPTWRERVAVEAARVSPLRAWLLTLGLCLLVGPIAIVGAFYGSGQTTVSIIAITVIGPLTEEVSKIVLLWWLAERRPWLLRSAAQILVLGLAGGLSFAVIENLLYLFVYIPDPPSWLVWWRWTVCVGLHVGCSLIATLGIWRMWAISNAIGDRPRISVVMPWLVAAAVVHGIYNAIAVLVDLVQGV